MLGSRLVQESPILFIGFINRLEKDKLLAIATLFADEQFQFLDWTRIDKELPFAALPFFTRPNEVKGLGLLQCW